MTSGYKTPVRTPVRPTAPLSAYVDYTPRRTFTPNRPDPFLEAHPDHIRLSRQSRAYYFHQLSQQDDRDERDNYMDSPLVRMNLGVDPTIASIPTDSSSQPPTIELANDMKREWSITDFEVGKFLGTGKFGTVYIARERTSQQVVAIKILSKSEITNACVLPFLKREIEIQAHLHHPHILQMYGYFHDGDHVYLVLEHASQGELYTLLKECGCFSEQTTAKYMAQIIDALGYLHDLGVIHRDIKPENVLIGEDGQLKLADFGWAVHDPHPRRRTFCGTLDYLPPEMIENRVHDEKVDLWALGVMCYELLVGSPPFEDLEGYSETYQRIIQVDYTFPKHLSAGARDFIAKLLHRDSRRRSRLSDIKTHPWIRSHTTAVNKEKVDRA